MNTTMSMSAIMSMTTIMSMNTSINMNTSSDGIFVNNVFIPSLIHPEFLETNKIIKANINSPFHRLNDNIINHNFESIDLEFYSETPPSSSPKIEQKRITPIYKGNGEFNYITNREKRNMLQYTWLAVELTNLWDFIAQPIQSFSKSNDERINIIFDKLYQLGFYGHTRKTLTVTLHGLQYIVKNGEKEFKMAINC